MTTSASHEALCPLIPSHGPAPHAAIMGHLYRTARSPHLWMVTMIYSCLPLCFIFLSHEPFLNLGLEFYHTLHTIL